MMQMYLLPIILFHLQKQLSQGSDDTTSRNTFSINPQNSSLGTHKSELSFLNDCF